MRLTDKIIEVLLYMKKYGKITKNEYKRFGFYILMWYLRDNGIAWNDGVDERGMKVWKLTPKGQKIAELIEELRRVWYGESENTTA